MMTEDWAENIAACRRSDLEQAHAAALTAKDAEVGRLREAFARLLRECESAHWPLTAEQMMPMNEARRALSESGEL